MKIEHVIVKADIVGDLDKNDCRDMFQIMMNREDFNHCILNCLIYLFSKHVNGFFELNMLPPIIQKTTNLFSCREESESRSSCIIMSLDKFDFIEIKSINDVTHVKSTIDATGFLGCCERAKKFCKEFEQPLSTCLDVFKEWIVHSESEKDENKEAKEGSGK